MTREKLAAQAVVGTKKVAAGAVTGARTAPDTLTAEQTREATLGSVPEAERAAAAESADDAERLGGRRPPAYLTGVEVASEAGEQSLAGVKEVTAGCPDGTFVGRRSGDRRRPGGNRDRRQRAGRELRLDGGGPGRVAGGS